MCQIDTSTLTSTGCYLIDGSEAPHAYSHITYWLCENAKDGRPCDNVSPVSGESRQPAVKHGPCPVCGTIDSASKGYDIATAQAWQQYESAISQANEERRKATSTFEPIVEIVRIKRGKQTKLQALQNEKEPVTEETFDGDYIDPMVLDEQPKKEIVSSNRPNFPEAMDTVMNNTTLSNRYTTSQASLDNASSLHPVYKVIESPRKYFKAGRVFSAVWTEPAGPTVSFSDGRNVSAVSFDQKAFTEIRRFVVARGLSNHCIAIPIHTFGGRGGEKATTHSKYQRRVFAVSDDWNSSQLLEEIPIKVEDPDITIAHGSSFIIFSKHYSIEHYLPVRNIGYIVKEALPALELHFGSALGLQPTKQASSATKDGFIEQAAYPTSVSQSNVSDTMNSLHSIEQTTFNCDYQACRVPRQKLFSRLDHYRDHLRDFHKEDLMSNRRLSASDETIWFATRDIFWDWWRCRSCLSRVVVLSSKYTCSNCGEACEAERIAARNRLLPGPGQHNHHHADNPVRPLSQDASLEQPVAASKTARMQRDRKGTDRNHGLLAEGSARNSVTGRFSENAGSLIPDTHSSLTDRQHIKPRITTSGKTRRKLSGAMPYSNADHPTIEPKPEYAVESASESATEPVPQTTFVFAVNELPLNDDPNNCGVAPLHNGNGRWIPPVYSNGFGSQTAGRLYRWNSDGSVTSARDCQWYEGQVWSSASELLTVYNTRTVFWCNGWAQFMLATGDASTRDVATSDHPHNRWWPLTFRHDDTPLALSRVEELGEEQYLAGSGRQFIADFGLGAYTPRDAPRSGGLAGNLAIIIALIAFSCQAARLDTVLLEHRAWRGRRWHSHGRSDGRLDERGVVVSIFLDPDNPEGSTWDSIAALEWEGGPLIR